MEPQPKPPTTKGPPERFTGEVWIDPIAQGQGPSPMGVAAIHFTPGARTAWHRHGIGQSLYVTEGEGRAQARGGALITIRSGDVVRAPGGEWHWHGAAPDHFMTHLSMAEGDIEWGEHVTDQEYRGRKEAF
jgi:quercetin dioxygenase-like cupin family protein